MIKDIPRFSIGKFKVSIVNLQSTLDYIAECIRNEHYGYICVSNARVAYRSNKEPEYCDIQNNSLLTLPDGKPLSWIAHNKGIAEVSQVAGNELFHALLGESGKQGYTHYFYGSTPYTIREMTARAAKDYPEAKILKAVSPPFQSIDNYDIDSLAEEINRIAPTFFWVGLGAPKQERLMAKLQPKLKRTICIGVGLVFEYYAGTVKRAPLWARKIGMEWLVRIVQQPRRIKMFFIPFIWTLKEIGKSKKTNQIIKI